MILTNVFLFPTYVIIRDHMFITDNSFAHEYTEKSRTRPIFRKFHKPQGWMHSIQIQEQLEIQPYERSFEPQTRSKQRVTSDSSQVLARYE